MFIRSLNDNIDANFSNETPQASSKISDLTTILVFMSKVLYQFMINMLLLRFHYTHFHMHLHELQTHKSMMKMLNKIRS